MRTSGRRLGACVGQASCVRSPLPQRLQQELILGGAEVPYCRTGERSGDLNETQNRLEGLRPIVAVTEVVAVQERVAAPENSTGACPLAETARTRTGSPGEIRCSRGANVQIGARGAGVKRAV